MSNRIPFHLGVSLASRMPSQADKRCGGLKMPAKSSACGLGLWRALCLQGPALAQPEQASTSARVVTALMPQPRSVDYGDGWLFLTGVLQIEWLGYRNSVLEEAVSRFQTYVARRTGRSCLMARQS